MPRGMPTLTMRVAQRACVREMSTGWARNGRSGGASMRRRMVPFIKRVHPDLFAQAPPEVRATNQTSLQAVNTIIDAAEALAGDGSGLGAGGKALSALVPQYALTFFLWRPADPVGDADKEAGSASEQGAENGGPVRRHDSQRSGNAIGQGARPGEPGAQSGAEAGAEVQGSTGLGLDKLHVELLFPQAMLAAGNSMAIQRHVSQELDRLLASVVPETSAADGGVGGGGVSSGLKGGRMGLRAERASRGPRPRGRQYSPEEFEAEILESIVDLTSGRSSGGGSRASREAEGLFGSRGGAGAPGKGRGGGARGPETWSRRSQPASGRGQGRSRWWPWSSGEEPVWEKERGKSRQVNDFLRSGRVLFKGVPLAREAEVLRRLHSTLVSHFDQLELTDQGVWGSVVLVVRAKTDEYTVRPHTAGPLLLLPEAFTERDLVRFLAGVLLAAS